MPHETYTAYKQIDFAKHNSFLLKCITVFIIFLLIQVWLYEWFLTKVVSEEITGVICSMWYEVFSLFLSAAWMLTFIVKKKFTS